jgi:hypothetical protein
MYTVLKILEGNYIFSSFSSSSPLISSSKSDSDYESGSNRSSEETPKSVVTSFSSSTFTANWCRSIPILDHAYI